MAGGGTCDLVGLMRLKVLQVSIQLGSSGMSKSAAKVERVLDGAGAS